MTQTQLNSFITILKNDAAAATPGTDQAEVMWQFKKALRQLCKALSADQAVPLRTIVDATAVSLNEASIQLNMLRSQSEAAVVATHAAEVDVLIAAGETTL